MVYNFFPSVVIGANLGTTGLLVNLLVYASVIYFINYLWQRRWIYYYGSQVPGPFAWPIVGNALQFIGGTDELFEVFTTLLERYKPIGRFWLGNQLFFGVTKPEYMEIVLNNALEKEKSYNLIKCAVGNVLVTAPVSIWKTHRKIIMTTFNQRTLNGFVNTFAKQSRILIEKIGEQSEYFDVVPFIQRCTFDIVSETSLGTKINNQTENNDYVHWLNRAMEIVYIRIFRIWLHPNFLWKLTAFSKELDDILHKAKLMIGKAVEERKEEYLSKKAKEDEEYVEERTTIKTLAECMAEAAITSTWDKEQIINEVLTMTVAASDTSANAIGFSLIMLGMHPKIQENVMEEQHEIFNNSLRDVNTEDLPKMLYLERVIKETLRLFPIAPTFSRFIDKDLILGKYVLPKGTSCTIAPIVVHRDPQYWPDPLRFDPERFLPENVEKRHPYTFIPFSAGPRNCIGHNYAMMSMKTLLSTILRHFTVTTPYRTVEDVKIKTNMVLKCVNGFNIALQRRIKLDAC